MKWTSRAIHEVSIPRPQHVVAFKVFSPTDYSKRFLDRVSAVTAYNDMVHASNDVLVNYPVHS